MRNLRAPRPRRAIRSAGTGWPSRKAIARPAVRLHRATRQTS